MIQDSYRDIKALSQSSLKQLDWNPRAFFRDEERWLRGEIDRPKYKPTSYQILGNMVDLMLTGETGAVFDAYTMYTGPMPPPQMLAFVEETLKAEQETSDMDVVAKRAYDKAGFKRDKIETVLTRFKTEGLDYYTFFKNKGDKEVVEYETYVQAGNMVTALRNDKNTSKYVNAKTEGNIEVIHQYQALYNVNGVDMKGMPDKMIIDHEEKTIQIIDYKTSSDDNFRKSFMSYRYDLQGSLYNYLVAQIYKGEYKLLPFIFIVAFSNNKTPELWKMGTKDLVAGTAGGVNIYGYRNKGFMQLIEDYKWHKEMDAWDYPREVYENGGYRELNCYE